MARVRNWPDFLAALFFLAVAVGAFTLGGRLEAGTADQMGPGYAPRLLAALLAVLGTVLLVQSLAGGAARVESGRLRPPLIISGAFAAFGLAVEPLGLAAAVALTSFAGGLAAERGSLLHLAGFSVALAAGCVAVFVLFLKLPLSIWPG